MFNIDTIFFILGFFLFPPFPFPLLFLLVSFLPPYLLLQDSVILYSSVWPKTYHVAQTGLEFVILPTLNIFD